MRDEDGQVTLWLLGLCVMLLFVGGLSLDLWRAMGERRVLAGVADTAALAGAGGLDLEAYRSGGAVVLDDEVARALAVEALARQGIEPAAMPQPPVIGVAADGALVVQLHGSVELTLLKVLLPHLEALPITVRAVAEPRAG